MNRGKTHVDHIPNKKEIRDNMKLSTKLKNINTKNHELEELPITDPTLK